MNSLFRTAQAVLLFATVLCCCAFSCGGSSSGSLHIFAQDTYYEYGILVGANPRPYQDVSAEWQSDLAGASGSVYSTPPGTTTGFTGHYTLANARIPADWFTSIVWDPVCGGVQTSSGTAAVPPDLVWECRDDTIVIPGFNSARFSLFGATPPTMSLQAQVPFTTSGGMPTAGIFDRNGSLVSALNATSVSSDGTTATFPFPTNNGAALTADMYSVTPANQTSPGVFRYLGANFITIGQTNTYSGAFGVDAADINITAQSCHPNGPNGQWGCDPPSSSTNSMPLVTQYYANQVSYNGHTMPVGIRPVTIKAYGYGSFTLYHDQYTTVTQTGPARAIVVNSGSNSVTILDLGGYATVANIQVGTEPMSVTLSPNSTKAYIANYGSGTVSEVDLSSLAVTRTVAVGSAPQSIAMDPGGSAIWIGGPSYLKKVDLNTFALTGTVSVNGVITSLASSQTQNQLAYTLVNGCCSGSSTFAAGAMRVSDLSIQGNYAPATASPYASYTMGGTLPTPAVSPGATQVSTQFGNAFAASATPTGFVIYELVGHKEIMRGTTATPVRGIASDPNNWVAYFAVPDSNQLITVPLPHN